MSPLTRVRSAAASILLAALAMPAVACVQARYEPAEDGVHLLIANNCGMPIRYQYCVRTDQPGFDARKVGSGFVNPRQEGGGRIWYSPGTRIVDTDLQYCQGAYCAPNPARC